MLLHLPDGVGPYLDLAFSFLKKGELDARLREAVILRVAARSSSEYERTQHDPSARKAGLTDEELAAIRADGPVELPGDLGLALRFADECLRDVRASDATFREARGRFSPRQLAELTLLVGFYMMTARFLETLEADIDPPVDLSKVG